MLLGQQLVLKGRGFRPSVQGQGLKRAGGNGGTFRKMVSIWLKRGNIAHIVIQLNESFHFRLPLWRFRAGAAQSLSDLGELWVLERKHHLMAAVNTTGNLSKNTQTFISNCKVQTRGLIFKLTLNSFFPSSSTSDESQGIQLGFQGLKSNVYLIPQIGHLLVTDLSLDTEKKQFLNLICTFASFTQTRPLTM